MSMSNLWARLFNTRRWRNKSQQAPDRKSRKRLFFALCPDESTRQALIEVQNSFPRPLSDHWVRPANLHIGLALSGGVGEEWLEDLQEAAESVQAADFELSLNRLTYWPHKRILCLTPSVVPAAMKKLVADLDLNLEAVGFEMGKRPHRTYLTLAREASYPPPEIGLAQAITWKVSSFALVESSPHGLGVAHRLVTSWPLSRPVVPVD